MADGVFNISKGWGGYYVSLPASSDSLIAVLLKAAGLEADDTLDNYDTLDLLLAANDEADFTNYSRQTLTSVSWVVDDVNNVMDASADNITFANAGGATHNSIGKLVLCYKPSSAAGDDEIVPVTHHDCVFTTDGTSQTISFAAAGFYRAS